MSAKRYEDALCKLALSYPETREDHPWGERVIKVRGKVFLFIHSEKELILSVKLPRSGAAALTMLPFASPTGYGLGKSGWVTAQFPPGKEPPMELLREWLDESYRAVAPKKLVASLDAPAPQAAPAKSPRKAATGRARAKPARRARARSGAR